MSVTPHEREQELGRRLLEDALPLQPGPQDTASQMASALLPMAQKREGLLEERNAIQARIKQIDTDVAFIEQVLRPAGVWSPVEAKPKRQRRQRSAAAARKSRRRTMKAGETMAAVIQRVAGSSHPVSAYQLSDQMGINRSSVQKCLKNAREAGVIRMAHRERGPNGGRERMYYDAYPDTLEKLERLTSGG